MNFVIHWNETSLSLHVFPIPIPPPTSLSTRSLQAFKHKTVSLKKGFKEDGSVTLYNLFGNSKRLDTGKYAKRKVCGDGIKMSSVPFKAWKEDWHVYHVSFSRIKQLYVHDNEIIRRLVWLFATPRTATPQAPLSMTEPTDRRNLVINCQLNEH